MKPEDRLKKKLYKALKSEIEKEKDVVYVFSLIRKLLEIYELKKEYNVLNFYSNWALHSKLDQRSSAKDEMLDDLEKALQGSIKAKSLTPLMIKLAVDYGTLRKIQNQIHSLAEKISLGKSTVENRSFLSERSSWKQFTTLLVEIVSDAPLRFPEKTGSTALAEVTLERISSDLRKKAEKQNIGNWHAAIGQLCITVPKGSKYNGKEFNRFCGWVTP